MEDRFDDPSHHEQTLLGPLDNLLSIVTPFIFLQYYTVSHVSIIAYRSNQTYIQSDKNVVTPTRSEKLFLRPNIARANARNGTFLQSMSLKRFLLQLITALSLHYIVRQRRSGKTHVWYLLTLPPRESDHCSERDVAPW